MMETSRKRKLFTVGPVEIEEEVLKIGARQPLYFRDEEFSIILREVTQGILDICNAPASSSAAILTSSGTAAMEAAVINLFNKKSKVLVVNSGSFSDLFIRMCRTHHIPYEDIQLTPGTSLTPEHLAPYANQSFDGLLMNVHETSTGQLHDVGMAGRFCKANGMMLICDAISAILADTVDMTDMHIDVAIFSSNKGLALPPGLGFVVLTEQARSRMCAPTSLYLDLNTYLINAPRGHTPYTSAVSVIMMLQERLRIVRRSGGPSGVIAQVAELGADFRHKARRAGISFFPETPSNALTAIRVAKGESARLYREIRDEFGYYINPSTFRFEPEIVKVGHLGALTCHDNSLLVDALTKKMQLMSLN